VKVNPASAASAGRLPALLPGDAEADLIQAARGGDRQAFELLVERHQDAVMTAAHYLVGDAEDAQDVAQEAFLRAYRSLAGFAGQSSFRTWLLAITTNAARSLATHRRAKKRTAREVRLDAGAEGEAIDPPEPEGRGCPEGLAMRAELKEALEAAIAGLDQESRSALVLRDLAGESYEAIASAQGLPLGTVKSRIHRARLLLRERLKKFL
jgi:RNA polymerase sigma-70 factor (ECF subfamily)